MPGFITHYVFGRRSYKNMGDSNIKKILKQNRNAYNMGLQGPDPFFYFLPNYMCKRDNIGTTLHTSKTQEFIKNMVYLATTMSDIDKRNVALAYTCGFLGHYVLDANSHPFVYDRTGYSNKKKGYIGKHFEYETDIDYLVCREELRKHFSEVALKNTVHISKNEKDTIEFLIFNSLCMTYTEKKISTFLVRNSIRLFEFEVGLLNDRFGVKRKTLGNIEKLLFRNRVMSNLLMSGKYKNKNLDPCNTSKVKWKNPWDNSITSNMSFYEIMDLSIDQYMEIVMLFDNYINNKSSKNYCILFNKLGNKSYKSGLELD